MVPPIPEAQAGVRSSRPPASRHGGDQLLHLRRMGAELARELFKIRLGELAETRLVDVADDADADGFELVGRLMLEFERLSRLHPVHLIGCRLHPRALFG